LVGAAIGYITNAIAIRMLFRPLSEKRILGVRVPFTPGIIPKQRHSLAESIGRMVSTKLLTEDAFQAQLSSPKFQRGVEDSVSSFTDRLLYERPEAGRREELRSFVLGMETGLTQALDRFVQSPAFEELVTAVVGAAVRGVSGMKVREVLGESSTVREFVDDLLSKVLSPQLKTVLVEAADNWLAGRVQENTPLSTFLTPSVADGIVDIADRAYDPVLEHALRWARAPENNAELARRGKQILRRILDKLNFFQRFLISAGQFDRQLELRMPEIIGDLLSTIEEAAGEPENRQRVLDAVRDGVNRLSAQGVYDFADMMDVSLEAKAHETFDSAFEVVTKPAVRNQIRELIVAAIDRRADDSVGDVMREVLSLDEERVAEQAVDVVRRWAAGPHTMSSLSGRILSLANRFFDRLEQDPPAEVLGIRPEQKAKVDNFVAGRLVGIIEEKVPELVRTLDVYTLVVNKIDGLDMENVERLLLMVIAKHLKWINLFGGLLGALIGGAQVLIGTLT
jgi:uncharacterized membrane protein YheB (UPF0754 family)